jgi:hypothetical protein
MAEEIWKKGFDPDTGWQYLFEPDGDTYARDEKGRLYRVLGSAPHTFRRIVEPHEIRELRGRFTRAFDEV